MASNHAAMAQLTNAITSLTTEFANVNENIIVTLQTKLAIRMSRGGCNRATFRRGTGAFIPRTDGYSGVRGPGVTHLILLDMRLHLQAQQCQMAQTDGR